MPPRQSTAAGLVGGALLNGGGHLPGADGGGHGGHGLSDELSANVDMVGLARMLLEQNMRIMLAKIAEYSKLQQAALDRAREEVRTVRQENDKLVKAVASSPNAGDIGGTGNAPMKNHDRQPPSFLDPPPMPTENAATMPSPPESMCGSPAVAWDSEGHEEETKDDKGKRRESKDPEKNSFFNKKTTPQKKKKRSVKKRPSISAMVMGKTNEAEDQEEGTNNGKKKGAPAAVFADASAMKEKIREAVAKKDYTVADFYYETGILPWIATSQPFEYTTLLVIAFNALWIAVDTDGNEADVLLDAKPMYQIAEHSFCVYFTFEWCVRFFSFRKTSFCFKDAWFMFDSGLVFMMVMETWVLTIVIIAVGGGGSGGLGNTSVLKLIRLVRLTRMARMARLLRAVPELIILIKGIVVASRSVFFTLCLLVIIMYFYAIVFRQLLGQLVVPGSEPDLETLYFPSVTGAMMALLLDGVLPDQGAFVRDCYGQSWILGTITLSYIMLASLTVMNMLVGVLVEVVSVVSAVEKEQLTVGYVKQRLLGIIEEVGGDEDGDALISKAEFDVLLMSEEAARAIQEIGVDVIGLVDMADYIFKDNVKLTFADLMELVLAFRGSNTSTVKDIVDMRRYFLQELALVDGKVQRVLSHLERGGPPLLGLPGPGGFDGGDDKDGRPMSRSSRPMSRGEARRQELSRSKSIGELKRASQVKQNEDNYYPDTTGIIEEQLNLNALNPDSGDLFGKGFVSPVMAMPLHNGDESGDFAGTIGSAQAKARARKGDEFQSTPPLRPAMTGTLSPGLATGMPPNLIMSEEDEETLPYEMPKGSPNLKAKQAFGSESELDFSNGHDTETERSFSAGRGRGTLRGAALASRSRPGTALSQRSTLSNSGPPDHNARWPRNKRPGSATSARGTAPKLPEYSMEMWDRDIVLSVEDHQAH
eukprot:TRINITY_DN100908_c0_g1_i1.p1 TRINITY_DN100908_c0_g1~~TRINITY_DN100908_c0_g1_i1.p1  ORF type:complete len:931 (-),score=212.61 TRINITY_DN100908_c0_g1_i1:151-2943(-)